MNEFIFFLSFLRFAKRTSFNSVFESCRRLGGTAACTGSLSPICPSSVFQKAPAHSQPGIKRAIYAAKTIETKRSTWDRSQAMAIWHFRPPASKVPLDPARSSRSVPGGLPLAAASTRIVAAYSVHNRIGEIVPANSRNRPH